MDVRAKQRLFYQRVFLPFACVLAVSPHVISIVGLPSLAAIKVMAQLLKPENVVAALRERVPAFAAARFKDESFISHEDDSPYLCFGDLGRFLLDLVSRKSNTAEEIDTIRGSFDLLNEMGNSSNPEVVNIVAVTVFEMLTDAPEGIAAARSYLSEQAANEFDSPAHLMLPG